MCVCVCIFSRIGIRKLSKTCRPNIAHQLSEHMKFSWSLATHTHWLIAYAGSFSTTVDLKKTVTKISWPTKSKISGSLLKWLPTSVLVWPISWGRICTSSLQIYPACFWQPFWVFKYSILSIVLPSQLCKPSGWRADCLTLSGFPIPYPHPLKFGSMNLLQSSGLQRNLHSDRTS